MIVPVQEQIPAWHYSRYGKPLQKVDLDRAAPWVHRAVKQTKRRVEKEFEGRGYAICVSELSFGNVRYRARLNTYRKLVILDTLAEADLHQEMESLGFPTSPTPREVILAHELFHLFCPRCPNKLAELAAHLYCAQVLELDYFPGILDIAEVFEPIARAHA